MYKENYDMMKITVDDTLIILVEDVLNILNNCKKYNTIMVDDYIKYVGISHYIGLHSSKFTDIDNLEKLINLLDEYSSIIAILSNKDKVSYLN